MKDRKEETDWKRGRKNWNKREISDRMYAANILCFFSVFLLNIWVVSCNKTYKDSFFFCGNFPSLLFSQSSEMSKPLILIHCLFNDLLIFPFGINFNEKHLPTFFLLFFFYRPKFKSLSSLTCSAPFVSAQFFTLRFVVCMTSLYNHRRHSLIYLSNVYNH